MVTMSWYLVKIVETHLEIIKDGGIVVFINFQGYLSFLFGCHFRFCRNKRWKPIFSESLCIKNIRSKVKLLLQTYRTENAQCPVLIEKISSFASKDACVALSWVFLDVYDKLYNTSILMLWVADFAAKVYQFHSTPRFSSNF